MCLIDLSKLLMYEFYFDLVKTSVLYFFYIFPKESISKNYEKCFLFHLKSSFSCRDSEFIKFCSLLFTVSRSKETRIIMT